jgi:3-oxoacyl-[acyl-carrier-protein] synthase II
MSDDMSQHRVVITGIGVVSPIGIGRDAFWNAALEGRSGAVRLESPWIRETGLATQIACPVRGFDPVSAGIPAKQIKLLDRVTWFALATAHEAMEDAGFVLTPREDNRGTLKVEGVSPARISAQIGTGIGGISTLETSHAVWREAKSKSAVKRYSLPMLIPNAPAGQVAIRFGAKGECRAVCTACAAGTMALGDAWRTLQRGEADVVLAGGAEGCAEDADGYALLGFDRLRTMSTRNDDPQHASRPFDKTRDGFVIGEGAAVLVLEREEHALARGARPYARIAGYATNCDAVSMMQLDETGESIVTLIRSALATADTSVAEVDHVNAHGTSTLLNDKTETRALRKVLGSRFDQVTVTALKSMTGHGIAASGAMETAALAMSFRHGVLTPTINYEVPDPECDVNLVANRPVETRLTTALKLSYGFGGHNACLVLTAP